MTNIGIVGGGITGLCSAWYLQKMGFKVTILDKGDFSNGCSYGNAGMIVPSHFTPFATPEAIHKAIRWLFKPSSPFAIHRRLNPELIRWLMIFFQSATTQKVRTAIPNLIEISLLSKALYYELAQDIDLQFKLHDTGILMLYKKAETEKAEIKQAKLANMLGIDARVLSVEEIDRLDPGIDYNVKGGVFYPGDAVIDPGQFMDSLKVALEKKGVTFLAKKRIDDLRINGRYIEAVSSKESQWSFDQYLLCSGYWTAELLKKHKPYLPLASGKGYSFNISNKIRLRLPSLLLDHKVSVSPFGGMIRFGGTMELGATNCRINVKKVQGIIAAIQQYYPQITFKMPEPSEIWHGFRPCSPDGLPYIGRLNRIENLTIATGHGMMGLSLGPATGKLVSQIIAGERTEMDVSAFDVNRFD